MIAAHRKLFASSALALIALPAAGLAQAAGSPAPGTAATTAPSPPSTPLAGTAAATAPAAPADAFPGDIVVTATRQEQVLSRVPVSVAAYNQQAMDLKGVKTVQDVVRFTPGIQFEAGSNEIAIRGISSGAGAGTTGIYIDDTPIQIRNLGFDSDDSLPAVFDLDRVEILRGPQGTLFGAGSEGGTVRYITPQPSLTTYSEYARAEVSSTAHGGISYEGGAALGGPIVEDKLGFRLSGWYRHDSGWIDKTDNAGKVVNKDANDGYVWVVRGALTWAPVDDLTITPTLHYQKRLTADDDFYVAGLSNRGDGRFRDSSPEYRRNPDRWLLPSLKVQYDWSWARLISNTSYFDRHNISGYDGTIYDLSYYQGLLINPRRHNRPPFPGVGEYPLLTPTGINPDVAYYLSPSVVTNTQRIFTQEVRLQSVDPHARFTWVAGAFFQRQRQLSREELVDPLGDTLFRQLFGKGIQGYFKWPLYGEDSYINESVAHERQLAGFADLTWHITDGLSVTGGVRYAELKYAFSNFADGSQNYGRTEASGSTKNHPVTPKANISWQIDPDNLVYGTYAKGFRPAGANAPIPYDACKEDFIKLGIPGAPAAYKPDAVNSFELGSKNRLLDHKLSIAASAYTIRWSGIQQFVFLPSCAIMYIDNLGKARARGFDLQLTATPIPGITLDAAVGYTDARYTSTVALGAILVSKGDAIGGAPWTVSLGAQYDFEVFDRKAYVRGDYQYASRLNRPTPALDPVTASYDPALVQSAATHFVSLRGGFLLDGFNVSLFVDNLLDNAPLIEHTHSDSDTLLFTDRTWRPRTIGLTVTLKK